MVSHLIVNILIVLDEDERDEKTNPLVEHWVLEFNATIQ